MADFDNTIPLSLYIHIPWCLKKCPYCDFNSHTAPDDLPEKTYIQALINELDEKLPTIWGRRLSSIFIGGGTPSLFSANSLDTLLCQIQSRLPFNSDLEITLEANPGTFEQARFRDYRLAGINRLSIGVQSFQADKLKILGRVHDGMQAKRAVDVARTVGFDNLNIDLMFGLPKQTIDDALFDLNTAIDFGPTHLSWYQLTIEPNTFFHHKPPILPQDDAIWDMQEAGQTLLAKSSFHQYEVSAYAQIEKQCRHNINYWTFGDYLGIGAGAHSKITRPDLGCVTRHWNVKNPKDYLTPKKNVISNETTCLEKDLIFEFMLNALRLTNGFPTALFTERTGLPLDKIKSLLALAEEKKLLTQTNKNIVPTTRGKRFLNDLIEIFL